MNKLKTISAVAMMGLILPVSLLASIGDAVKKTEYLGWESQATSEILKFMGDLEKPKTPELVYGMLVSGRTIVQLRLNMQKTRIDAIDLDDNSLETTYKNELGTLLDGIRVDFENRGEEVMDLGETLSIDDFGDIDDLDSAEIDILKQKLLDLFAAFYGPNSLNSRLSILTWKVNAVARYELYMAHAKRLTDEIVNVLPASLYTGDIVTKVDAYKAGELATMKACAMGAYGLSTKAAIKEKIKGDCETAQKASNDKFDEIKGVKDELMKTVSGGTSTSTIRDCGVPMGDFGTAGDCSDQGGICMDTYPSCGGESRCDGDLLTNFCPGDQYERCCVVPQSTGEGTGSTGESDVAPSTVVVPVCPTGSDRIPVSNGYRCQGSLSSTPICSDHSYAVKANNGSYSCTEYKCANPSSELEWRPEAKRNECAISVVSSSYVSCAGNGAKMYKGKGLMVCSLSGHDISKDGKCALPYSKFTLDLEKFACIRPMISAKTSVTCSGFVALDNGEYLCDIKTPTRCSDDAYQLEHQGQKIYKCVVRSQGNLQ